MYVTIDDLIAAYLASHLAAGHRQATVDWYGYELRRYIAYLQDCGLQGGAWLQLQTIERYLAYARDGGNAPATVAGHWRALRGFFNWLVERGHLEKSPLAGTKPPRVPKKAPRRAIAEEYLCLIENIPEGDWVDMRDRLIISTLFLCGVRLGECARLTVGDFRISEHLLRVKEGKGGHERLVPLLPAVERAFVAYRFVCPPHPSSAMFLAANGARQPTGIILANGIRQMLRRRCRRAGLRLLNPHSFRHGLAMHLLNSGGDMSLVQKVLGHAQITTTARYYAEWLTDGMLREFSDKMDTIGR